MGLEVYFPHTYIKQTTLEKADGVSSGKYVKGLEQEALAFCGDREDIVSIFMTATHNLLKKYDIHPEQIGRLECGTETLIDKSKSIKTNLMPLLGNSTDVEGVDNINACYGGTAALLNTLAWMQSPAWDGRYGVVVCGDIAVYEPGPARPTGGVGAVAMLIGPNAPMVVEPVRGSHFEHAYDFYKPNLHSEYPAVDGHLSISCYFRSLDRCYDAYRKRFRTAHRRDFDLAKDANFSLFHSPFGKLVRKSYARLFQNEWLEGKDKLLPKLKAQAEWKGLSQEKTYTLNDMHKAFMEASEHMYEERVSPSLLLPRQLGNSYTGSLYTSLASLIENVSDKDLADRRALMFSYGSGSAATMFSIKFDGPVQHIRSRLNLKERLHKRRAVEPQEYLDTMLLREETHSLSDYSPTQRIEDLFPGTYYLKHIDKLKRRTYALKQ